MSYNDFSDPEEEEEYIDRVVNLNNDKSSLNSIILDTYKKGKQAIVFVNSKRSAEKVAEDIMKLLKRHIHEKSEIDNLLGISESILGVLSSPTTQCRRLAGCILGSSAFHHSGLVSKQRDIVEEEFRNGNIKFISATPTLAAGVDLPAYRVIIRDLRRHTPHGYSYIPVLEYLQQAGRAGRPKYDNSGQAICIARNDKDRLNILKNYVLGSPENVYSKLAVEPVLRFYILSLISTKTSNSLSELVSFFTKTFWGHQYGDVFRISAIIKKMIDLLISWDFIKYEKKPDMKEMSDSGSSDMFLNADEILKPDDSYKSNNNKKEGTKRTKDNKNKIKPIDKGLITTMLGDRVAQLYIDPYSANLMLEGLSFAANKKIKKIDSFALLQIICSALEMKPLLGIRSSDYENLNIVIEHHKDTLLCEPPDFYDEDYEFFLMTVKTAMMLDMWINEADEEKILEKFSVRPGGLRNQLFIAKWLLYSLGELARFGHLGYVSQIKRIEERIKYGVRDELLTLLKLKNIGKIRARKLFLNGYKNLGMIKDANFSDLANIIGKSFAINVKEQLGEKVDNDDVKRFNENKSAEKNKIKRKSGQSRLGDF